MELLNGSHRCRHFAHEIIFKKNYCEICANEATHYNVITIAKPDAILMWNKTFVITIDLYSCLCYEIMHWNGNDESSAM